MPPDLITTIAETGDGIFITVRVIPRAGRSEVTGVREGALLVRLKAPPVDGAANAELIALLAGVLGVPKRSVTIVAGAAAKHKRVKVVGVTADAAASRLPH